MDTTTTDIAYNPYSAILSDPILLSFSFILFVLFIWAIVGRQNQALKNYAPTLLTTVGILGTFVGIAYGLFGFDPRPGYIDASIAGLLDGLKIAFITSLLGMLLAIIYKTAIVWKSGQQTQQNPDMKEEVGIEDLLNELSSQSEQLTLQNTTMSDIKKSLSDDSESSLVGAIKLLRSDNNDLNKRTHQHLADIQQLTQKQADDLGRLDSIAHNIDSLNQLAIAQQTRFNVFEDRLWIKLQDFADMLSKSATEQVIEALKAVITDFNNNLTEQFGDNFKQLNQAVLSLVEWQENYKQQLLEMQQQYALGVASIEKTQVSVQHISHSAEAIPVNMDKLKTILDVGQHQLAELERHLHSFEQMRDKAVEAVPQIQANIEQTLEGVQTATRQLTEGLDTSATQMSRSITKSVEDYENSIDRVNGSLQQTSDLVMKNTEHTTEAFDGFVEQMSDNLNTVANKQVEFVKTLQDNIQSVTQQLDSQIKNVLTQLDKQIKSTVDEHIKQTESVRSALRTSAEKSLADTAESVQKQVSYIDEALEKEINKSMSSMGSALTSITQKFTKDYTVLVNEMKQVVEAARR
ncbi:hypothetical protein [Thiomicrospira microaerophila]|uniref:hypothetical protein n=1 Tax=Thiomicrospira microaerophila TaxID=406020 RepID=UPI0006988F35|nr:hypothetical protein [Thiomicrospira microaerophila]